MLIRILFIMCISVLGLSPQHASAEWPTHIERSVAPGGTVVIFKVNHYQDARGCTPLPAGSIDGDPKPRLGTLVSIVAPVVGNGPCGKMEYNVQTISYKAGTIPGTDEFVLYIYPGGWPGGSANRINLKISVGGQRAPAEVKKLQTQPVKTTSAPSDKKPSLKTNTDVYVNNFGNKVSIEGDFVYFTGTWSGEKVQRKPFAIEKRSDTELIWAMYDCEGGKAGFTCTHRGTKEQRIYKRLPK